MEATAVRTCALRSWLAAAALLASAATALGQLTTIGPELLRQEEAFRIAPELSGGSLEVTVAIADGYYLYKDRVGARVLAGGGTLSGLELPEGKVYTDEFFGETEIYRDEFAFSAAVDRPAGAGDLNVELVVQGCADAGVCYPPYVTSFAFPAGGGQGVLVSSNLPDRTGTFSAPSDNTDGTVAALSDGSLPYVVLFFFNAGLLLSFTPCVLPMVPIALAVVTGGARPGGRRALALGGSYVLGMAAVYTLIGLLVAQSGSTFLAGSLQNPYVLVPMSIAFISLAFVMYRNVSFHLLPQSVRNRLSAVASRSGTHSGALLAGGVSAVVVSPCVAVPLVGALIYIATVGDRLVGGVALFSLAVGMGMLPLAAAAGAGRFLPKAGPVSEAVRKLFALALAALGVWVLGALVPPAAKLVAYGLLGAAGAVILFRAARGGSVSQAARLAVSVPAASLLALSAVLATGGLTGATNELRPVAHLFGEGDAVRFETVSTELSYRAALSDPGPKGTFEYYYADWCVSCRELEAYAFTDPELVAALDGYRAVKVDLTANDADSLRLLEVNSLFGPPAIIVRDRSGMKRLRYVGFLDGDELAAGIEGLGG